MINNIKKVPVKFQEDLLYFQHFILIFALVWAITSTFMHGFQNLFWCYCTI